VLLADWPTYRVHSGLWSGFQPHGSLWLLGRAGMRSDFCCYRAKLSRLVNKHEHEPYTSTVAKVKSKQQVLVNQKARDYPFIQNQSFDFNPIQASN